ncbi:type II toxin-antitoxin system VapB family antitoxin [Ruania alkalisoli]|uniref:Type II toxin-antitoxin system VapB family antitoxin n=1 Tax=Ruania alkalisoli TaxID=2779775 RepID=A0A7M1SW07_9MICO|nr:type II toxin-antitoxin system VapB family antitoxin [Ruania alkalisoli]QOR71651.1 type II toxin-antitoxin system VapB family antitoxin [Ruania alkalisoli]
MALNIKDPETDRLARELADRMGVSITAALKAALTDRLARTTPKVDVVYTSLVAVGERGRARAVLDDRPVDQIITYDDHGLPA